MEDNAKKTRVNVIPAMRYHDAAAAIEWLCEAFGFERHLVVPGENGTIAHAELTFGNGMIMLGSARDDEYGKLIRPPRDLQGVSTQGAYVVVTDTDAHYRRAVAAGAKIVTPLENQFWGERYGDIVDPFGHRWSLSMQVKMSPEEMESKRRTAMSMFEQGEHPGRTN